MIRFFRKIRQQSLLHNRFTKYLIYAVGEVVLITIGIMLAMEFNDWNDSHKTERRITGYLSQVQNDLERTISYCDEMMAHYMIVDNVIREIMNNELTYEDYNSPERRLYEGRIQNMGLFMFVPDSGYQNLVKNFDSIPENYGEIFTQLERIYTLLKLEIEMRDKNLQLVLSDFNRWLQENKMWYSDIYFAEPTRPLPQEEIEFYLSDPRYKNWVMTYFDGAIKAHHQSIANMRASAVASYEELSQILGLEEAEGLSCNVNVDDYRPWVGKYEVSSSNWDVPYNTLSIHIEEDRIMVHEDRPDAVPSRRFPVDTSSYAFPNGFIRFERNEEGKITGFASRLGSRITRYKKIE